MHFYSFCLDQLFSIPSAVTSTMLDYSSLCDENVPVDFNKFNFQINKNSTAVLFINIIDYNTNNTKRRSGANKDADYMYDIFRGYSSYGYSENQTANEVKDEIQSFVTNVKFEKLKNLLLIISAHGTYGEVVAFDGEKIQKTEILEILKYNNNSENRLITTILQTCRKGSMRTEISSNHIGQNLNIPEHMRIVHSTQPGCRALRSKTNGTYFFQAMHLVYKSNNMEIGNFGEFLNNVQKKLSQLLPPGKFQQIDLQSDF